MYSAPLCPSPLTPHPPPRAPPYRPTDINLVYEVWKDVKVKAVQVTHPNPFIHIPRLLLIWGGCNLPCALLLVAVSRAVYGPHA